MADAVKAWIERAWYLYHVRSSAQRYKRIAAHWRTLTVPMIYACSDRETLAKVEPICDRLHLKPLRGHRRGTHWEAIHVAVCNRLQQLNRAADWQSMGTGHNSRNAGQEVFR